MDHLLSRTLNSTFVRIYTYSRVFPISKYLYCSVGGLLQAATLVRTFTFVIYRKNGL